MKTLQQLRSQLADVRSADRHRLTVSWNKLHRAGQQSKDFSSALQKLQKAMQTSQAAVEQRRQQLPPLEYGSALPVVDKREDIGRAILENQVVVICGETGSGKTTQLPKICLEIGRGVRGLIGHTQPRRIAARSVASRIAEELHTTLGHAVGYKVRFNDQVSEHSYVKLMTDGILLAEMQGDRFLQQYDTLIIDEAHERSLNIDFLLGYLKQLLPKRPDLKVIITSATIDPERFARHFNHAPVIEVSGRTYPVETRYRPLVSDDADDRDRDLQQAILDAVDEVSREGPGDVLIFLPGEREIRETAEALRKHHPPQTEILPLFSRLTAAEQNKVFKSHGGRRIVLATNVAETSLTVPGIRFVIDPGYARISRYSARTKLQRLPIEPISQASANQRQGRCGRVSAGICVRLFSEEDFLQRPEFTDAEILRTNLASVILQMQSLRLGAVEAFPFVDPPDSRAIKDGLRLLFELGAVDQRHRITTLGTQLARLPIDPRLGRMILAANEQGSLQEVLIIAAALSIQDPRERPFEKQQAADEQHRRFHDEKSDFLSFLKLWEYLSEQSRHLSQNKLRKRCKKEFISYVRYREWKEVLGQLKQVVRELSLRLNEQTADYSRIHLALLTGLISHVGLQQEKNEYLGARNSRFFIFPGSGLFKKSPKWVMAAEIVETGRVFGRCLAKIEPQWLESTAPHLLKRSYFDPHWEKRRAQVAAFERVSVYGLPVVARRKINYGPIEPQESREIFIRHALVYGEYRSQAKALLHNRQLIEEVESLEAKSRRQDILVDEHVLFDFFDARLPQNIYSGHAFEKWYKKASDEQAQKLFLSHADLMRHEAAAITEKQFPEQLAIADISLPLSYHFKPGHSMDGVTASLPLSLLASVPEEPFQWLVPGLLEEKLTLLIKGLPKSLRKNFVPAPQFARACMEALRDQHERALLPTLSHQLKRMSGIDIPDDAWQPDALPPHLQMNFCVVDEQGKSILCSRDLTELKTRLKDKLQKSFAQMPSHTLECDGKRQWDFGDLPEQLDVQQAGLKVKGYPAIVDQADSVAVTILGDPQEARRQHYQGLLRLFMLGSGKQYKYLLKNLPGIDRMCLQYAKVQSCQQFKEDILTAVFAQTFMAESTNIRKQQDFRQRLQQGQPKLAGLANDYCQALADTFDLYQSLQKKLKSKVSPAWIPTVQDIQAQLQQLLEKGFVSGTPWKWLQQFPRYLKAAHKRFDTLAGNEQKDRHSMMVLKGLWEKYQQRRAAGEDSEGLQQYRWMIEELRVSFFAQELKTLMPVSEKRLLRYLEQLK